MVDQTDKTTDVDNSSRILHFIEENPACHLRQIKDFDKVHTLPVHAKISPKP